MKKSQRLRLLAFSFKPKLQMDKFMTAEYVVPVTATNGSTTATASANLNAGEVVGVVIINPVLNNAGMVRASIKNGSGLEVSQLQHIDNYRSREAAYWDSFKPLPDVGGQRVTIDIIATVAFTANTYFDVIFIYKTGSCNI